MTLKTLIQNYLSFCKSQKCLDDKTIKAYRIDLTQFSKFIAVDDISQITIDTLESFIASLHQTYKPKTAKRKIATIKTFYHYLEYKDIITLNPFNKMQIKFREPVTLPKTIPLHTVEDILKRLYKAYDTACTPYQKQKSLQDIAVVELLFATGIRISELCSLKASDVNLYDNTILIYGKGSKERCIQIGNDDVTTILTKYSNCFSKQIKSSNLFFVNRSDQSIRRMLRKYGAAVEDNLRITPHMFRHTFATSLLEEDVDIRYIQEMLGHSSINITEIYTHVAASKQKDILRTKHPRRSFRI